MSLSLTRACAALALFGLAMNSAGAQTLYKWTDERGVIHYSATVPPEASKKSIDEMRYGRVVRRTEAQLSPEELKARQDKELKEAETRRKEREQATRLKILHERYGSLEALDAEIAKTVLDFLKKRSPLLALTANLQTDIEKYEQKGAKNEAAQVKKQLQNAQAALASVSDEERVAVGKLQEDRRLWIERTPGAPKT